MKITLALLTGLLCFNMSTLADVFVYKNKLNHVYTGAGGMSKAKVTGWTVLNEFGDIVQVLAFADRRYAIVPLESVEYGVADAGAGRQYSYFIQHDLWSDGNGLHIHTGGAKGLNTVTTVNGNLWSIPKTFSWAGRAVDPSDSSGGRNFTESSGSFAFDKKWTAICNDAGDNLDTAVQRLADSLVQQGYTEY